MRVVRNVSHFLYAGINPTLVGLSLVYLLTLANYFEWCVRVGAEAENLVSSVDIETALMMK